MTRRPPDQNLWGRHLRRWPDAELDAGVNPAYVNSGLRPFEVWRSRDFLVQLFDDSGTTRVTVNRTFMPNGIDWADGISWDDLQEIKSQIGRGDAWAVELYPAEAHVVRDANMRHLWLLEEPPPFGWHATESTASG